MLLYSVKGLSSATSRLPWEIDLLQGKRVERDIIARGELASCIHACTVHRLAATTIVHSAIPTIIFIIMLYDAGRPTKLIIVEMRAKDGSTMDMVNFTAVNAADEMAVRQQFDGLLTSSNIIHVKNVVASTQNRGCVFRTL